MMTREANPIPQGKYVPATRFGNMIFTAGMTPRNNGVLLKTGKIKATDEIADYKEAVVQAAKNALTAAKNKLENGEKIAQIMQITVYVNSETDFTKQPKIADFASEYFCEELGESGVGSRAAVGVAVLPGDAPVEISIIAGVENDCCQIENLCSSHFLFTYVVNGKLENTCECILKGEYICHYFQKALIS